MDHLHEKTIELYVLNPEQLGALRVEIEAHLRECPGCAALHKEISEYYEEVEKLQPEEALSEAQALTLRDWIVRADTYKDRVPLQRVRRTIPLRAAIFITQHPVAATLSFSGLVVVSLLLLFFTRGIKDLNPAYARAKNEFLIAYNKEGQELWKKHYGLYFDYEDQITKAKSAIPLDQLLRVVDVDGDGKNEVVSINPWAEAVPLKETVYCYNPDGSERWTYELHRMINFGTESYADDFSFLRMMLGDFDGDGVLEVVAVAHHMPDFPCVVVQLDARNGKFLGEYWHPGYLVGLDHTDMDGDGVEELILGGVSNAFAQGALVILDPRRMSGHAPGTAKYIPQGVPEGTEKYYLLFPHTDLVKVAVDMKGSVGVIRIVADGLVEVGTGEDIGDGRLYGPMYYFDSNMKVVKLLPEVGFEALHHRLEAEGKLTRKLDEQYYKELREGVRYWDGENFVKEPTMNKKYLEVAGK